MKTPRASMTVLVAAVIVALVGGCGTMVPGRAVVPIVGPGNSGAPSGLASMDFPTPQILEQGRVPAYAATTPVTGHLTLGTSSAVASKAVDSAGGTLVFNGLRIIFGAGALAADSSFSVSSAAITGSDFGMTVTPVTPLYKVESKATLRCPVTVRLDAAIPTGATAMALWYDEAAGTLTPMVPVAQDAISLTAGATRFSSFFGALINVDRLPTTVDSGFRPGRDDWQFSNYGSFVEPGGQSEGQSLSALWYYVTQRRGVGARPLFGLSDNDGAQQKTPSFSWDDANGYRFVSAIQDDPVATPFTYMFLKNAFWDRASARLTYEAFRAAIALSGEPQLIRISPAPGKEAHTMIVYRVTPDRLYVADPNYPGHLRTIRYDAVGGTLGGYSSGANAADISARGATFNKLYAYVPWRSARSAQSIADHWAEYVVDRAGDAVFPPFIIETQTCGESESGTWVPLITATDSHFRDLSLRLVDPSGDNTVIMAVYSANSRAALAVGNEVTIRLQVGDNNLGFWVAFKKSSSLATDRGEHFQYVDFARVTVRYHPVAVDPRAPTATLPP